MYIQNDWWYIISVYNSNTITRFTKTDVELEDLIEFGIYQWFDQFTSLDRLQIICMGNKQRHTK
jgi:hypothetical protein